MAGVIQVIRYAISSSSTNVTVLWFVGDPLYHFGSRLMVNVCLFFCVSYATTSVAAFHYSEDKRTNYWYDPFYKLMVGISNVQDVELDNYKFNLLHKCIKLWPLFNFVVYVNVYGFAVYAFATASFGCYLEDGAFYPCLGFLVHMALFWVACIAVRYYV